MKKFILILILLCSPIFLVGQDMVEKIEIQGNERVTKETILYYLSSRAGDYFNQETIRRDFRILWATGFFSDIKIEEADGPSGKIIIIIVEENPVVKEIVYKTGKKVKEDDIVNKLKENDDYILPYSYYSPHKIQRIEKTIKDLLLEKGLASGKVEHEIKPKGKNELEITFQIDEGPKVKVGEIIFEGSPKMRKSALMSAFKDNKKHGVFSWVTGKDTFKENKLADDLENLRKKFQENGYMEAKIGEPRFEDIQKRSIFLKKQTMKKMIIPVDAGYLYFVGEVKVEGNEFFNARYVRNLIKFKEGEVYSTKVREKAVEKIGELYRDFGYLYAGINPVEKLDPKNKKVNVTFNIYEGEVAYLHRLEFKGNMFTKDKVIRREMMLREGDRFSFALFKDSLLRMGQLGLVELEGEPEVLPDTEDPTKINVNVAVTEMQRNNIQFTAGYSGYQGTFVALSYSTVNFLGAGEKLDLSLQYGKRIRNYSFGFTEPYLFDLPMNAGFNIHDMYMRIPGLYNRRSKGVDLSVSGRIKGYWRSSLVYSYDKMELTANEDDYEYYNPYGYGGGYGGYSGGYGGGYGGYGGYNPYYGGAYGYGKYNISAITPSFYRNTVDSPLTPSRGSLVMVSLKYAGKFLGGDVDMIKPRFEVTKYIPVIKGSSIGFHAEYSYIHKFGDTTTPYWERFYLGGERSIRGYEYFSIGPREESGYNLGGEKSFVLNAEYIMPLGGPIYAIMFYDMGNAYASEQKVSLNNMYSSAGLEMRIFVPALRVPFRLIFAYNNRLIRQGDSNFNFRFAIGTTF